MKKFFYLLMLVFLASCSNYLVEEEDDEFGDYQKEIPLTLNVRSGSQSMDIEYPINVFIFDDEGYLVNESVIRSERDPLDVHLSAGEYSLSAFTGLNESDYNFPKKITSNSTITHEKGEPCYTALQFGSCSFKLQKKTALSIRLSYIVTSLEFKFSNIPDDATEVEVGISPSSDGFTMDGNYTNENSVTRVTCQREGDYWTAGPIYILPSQSAKTTLSLMVDRPDGSETLSYTYTSQLQPAQPYRFSGKYNEGIKLNGSFEVEGWKPGIDVEFDFTENGQQESDDSSNEEDNQTPDKDEDSDVVNPGEEDAPTILCNSIPQAGDFWKGFYVWKTDKQSSETATAVLISKYQWFNIQAADGPELLDEYSDSNLSHWRVFTKEEAHEFNEEFATTMDLLNKKMRDNDQDEFYYFNKERYLCDDCNSAFNVCGKITLRAAGKTTKYYMRGVKTVNFKLNN